MGTIALLYGVTGILDAIQFATLGLLGIIICPIESMFVFIVLKHVQYKWSPLAFVQATGRSLLPVAAMTWPWLMFVSECIAEDTLASVAPLVAETVGAATK